MTNRVVRRRAAALLIRLAGVGPCPDPVCAADRRTSVADARAAFSISTGTAVDDIDPATGYDRSHRAYLSVRASWVGLIKYHGVSGDYDRPALSRAYADWAGWRPESAAGDDWAAAGVDAHRAYWAEVGRHCNRDGCLLHEAAGAWQYAARYAPDPVTGATPFACWTVGAAEVIHYSPEGSERERAEAPAGADLADIATVMLTWGDPVSIERQDRIYPAQD